jgi:hypothetical protein
MMHFQIANRLICLIACALLALPAALSAADENPALRNYSNDDALGQQVASLASSEFVTATSLGKTLGGREMHLLMIGSGKAEEKPAILIVGNVHAPHLAGGELALRVARQLAEKAKTDANIKELLERHTFYVIPRPNPDGSEKCLSSQPHFEHEGNARQTDDDRDFDVGEDPPDDLNGDGWITMMRVADDTGQYMPHPDDPRVLIKADAKKNERGRYRLYVEGKDDDGDEQFNEDAASGVSLNRNFTFRYPSFDRAAGPHAVSEIESRAIADFAFDHPNIAVVFTFTPEDNLMNPWKPNTSAEGGRIKTTLLSADAPYQDFIANSYQKAHGGKSAPASPPGEGSFSEWAYFHYGRWSLAARGWWIPQVAAPAGDKAGEKKPSDEKRGADDINALRWFAEQAIDGFVAWTPVEHPDFPGKRVEVGGFKPFYQLNPPAAELDALAERHFQFLTQLPSVLPRIELRSAKAEPLGGGVYRVSATVVNNGYLPTMSEMGRVSQQAYPLQIKLDLPADTQWIQGSPRVELGKLDGNGGQAERTWIVRLLSPAPATAKLKVWAPAVGSHEIQVELK